MQARIERLREGVLGVATAFHQPEKIDQLYPRPLPPKKIKWWGDADGR
jgi:hypothetical protein